MVWSNKIPQQVKINAKETLEKRLENTYHDFLSTMNPILGINLVPKNKIEVKQIFIAAGYISRDDPKKIVIGTDYWEEALGFDCDVCFDKWVTTKKIILGHEIGHIYHSKLNPEQFSKTTFEERRSLGNNWFLGEVIAELTMMTYFKVKSQSDPNLEFSLAYTYDDGTNIGLISSMLVRDNTENLEPLLRYLHRADLSEALKILDPYREKSKETIVVADQGLYFGFCGHKNSGNKLYRQLTLF